MPSASKLSSMPKKIGDPKILERKIPKNPKYENVKHVVNTGSSLSGYMEKLSEKYKYYKYKPNELFKRIKPLTFARLVHETSISVDLNSAELQSMTTAIPSISLHYTTSDDTNHHQQQHPTNEESRKLSLKSQFFTSNVIMSTDEMDKQIEERKLAEKCDYRKDLPFLLLDVRSSEEYFKSHIVSAVNYSPQLIQTAHQFSPDMLKYKNAKDKLIIVYDSDESVASTVCTAFCERGIENVWMLSGGLEALSLNFRCLLVSWLSSEESLNLVVDFLTVQNAIFGSDPEPTISDVQSVRSARISSSSNRTQPVKPSSSSTNRFVPRSRGGGAGGLSF